jgi:hypothetical protein
VFERKKIWEFSNTSGDDGDGRMMSVLARAKDDDTTTLTQIGGNAMSQNQFPISDAELNL